MGLLLSVVILMAKSPDGFKIVLRDQAVRKLFLIGAKWRIIFALTISIVRLSDRWKWYQMNKMVRIFLLRLKQSWSV